MSTPTATTPLLALTPTTNPDMNSAFVAIGIFALMAFVAGCIAIAYCYCQHKKMQKQQHLIDNVPEHPGDYVRTPGNEYAEEV